MVCALADTVLLLRREKCTQCTQKMAVTFNSDMKTQASPLISVHLAYLIYKLIDS